MNNVEYAKKRSLVMKYHGWNDDEVVEHILDAGINALFNWTLECIEKDLKECE